MSISKTRQKLVDVARQLFARNGLENTTMNDIALASGKGRRTLYTYFKSKEDILRCHRGRAGTPVGQAGRGGSQEGETARQDYRTDLHASEHD